MITKLTSIKSVIAKIIADLDIKEDDIKISDIREWIGEGIEKIGAFTQFTQNVDVIPIKGHQAKLPCNLHQLHQVAYSFNCDGPWFPMRKATGSFAVWNECSHDCNCTPEMLIKDDTVVNLVVDMIGNINKTEAIELLNTNQNLRTIINNLIKVIIARPRPEINKLVTETGYSFPSGHSITSMVFYGYLVYLTYKYINNKKIKIPLIIFLILLIPTIGLSRIYLGVHYASDVLCGFLLGTIYLILFISISKKYLERK